MDSVLISLDIGQSASSGSIIRCNEGIKIEDEDKAWAFNYIAGSDVFQGLSDLFSFLMFWEEDGINETQIESQVSEKINTTI